jgi:uncharacterized repeat protein (TIGR01451 family)
LVYNVPLLGNYRVLAAGTSFNGSPDYFLDWRFPYAILKQETGLTDSSPIRLFFGSSSSTQQLTERGADLVGASDLLSGFSDFVTPLGPRPTTGDIRFVTGLDGNGDVEVVQVGDTLYLRVSDLDQDYDNLVPNTVTVTLTTFEGDAESLVLTETGGSTGVFTGMIATAASVDGTPTTDDGTLQIAPGEVVTATYIDAIDAQLARNQPRTDTVRVAGPAITLTKTVDRSTAPPGAELLYTIHFRNNGEAEARSLLITEIVPAYTEFVSGSLRIGSAVDTYETAEQKTDQEDGDGATFSDGMIVFYIPQVTGSDQQEGSGDDEGKVFFRVRIE